MPEVPVPVLNRNTVRSGTPAREACVGLMPERLLTMGLRSGVTVVGRTPDDVVDDFLLMTRVSGGSSTA